MKYIYTILRPVLLLVAVFSCNTLYTTSFADNDIIEILRELHTVIPGSEEKGEDIFVDDFSEYIIPSESSFDISIPTISKVDTDDSIERYDPRNVPDQYIHTLSEVSTELPIYTDNQQVGEIEEVEEEQEIELQTLYTDRTCQHARESGGMQNFVTEQEFMQELMGEYCNDVEHGEGKGELLTLDMALTILEDSLTNKIDISRYESVRHINTTITREQMMHMIEYSKSGGQ